MDQLKTGFILFDENSWWRPSSIYNLDRVIHERDIYKLRMTFGPKSEKRAVGKIHSSAKMN